jgi:hypothetical protein
MCSSGSLSKAQPHIDRGADVRSAVMMGWVDDLRSKGQIPSNTKESTPPIPQSNSDSGLSIRRSTSGSSSNTSNRRGGSRSGARKRYKTT